MKPIASRTIVIVDDEPSVRVSLEYVLSSAGYSTLVAESGAAAVTAMDGNAIDAALIDVHMPVMSGFDTCLRLKAKAAERGRNLAVWLMTGACSARVQTRAAAIGAMAVFVKPFDYPAFFATLEAGLSATRSASAPAA